MVSAVVNMLFLMASNMTCCQPMRSTCHSQGIIVNYVLCVIDTVHGLTACHVAGHQEQDAQCERQ